MKPRAFTLIELLLALALSAVLMLGLLTVIGAMGKTQAAMSSVMDGNRPEHDRLIELLRIDLMHARQLHVAKVTDSEQDKLSDQILFRLSSHGGSDRHTLEISHRPVEVTYSIRNIGSRNWVIRTQTDLDVLSNQNRWSQLVCTGVADLQVESLNQSPTDESTFTSRSASSTEKDSLTGNYKLTIVLDQDPEPIEELIIVR